MLRVRLRGGVLYWPAPPLASPNDRATRPLRCPATAETEDNIISPMSSPTSPPMSPRLRPWHSVHVRWHRRAAFFFLLRHFFPSSFPSTVYRPFPQSPSEPRDRRGRGQPAERGAPFDAWSHVCHTAWRSAADPLSPCSRLFCPPTTVPRAGMGRSRRMLRRRPSWPAMAWPPSAAAHPFLRHFLFSISQDVLQLPWCGHQLCRHAVVSHQP